MLGGYYSIGIGLCAPNLSIIVSSTVNILGGLGGGWSLLDKKSFEILNLRVDVEKDIHMSPKKLGGKWQRP